MGNRRLIDKIRDSGGSTHIGTSEDGAIIEMVKVGKKLIVIKERAIYELMMADDIDPQRTNINIPAFVQKLLINQGIESEVVSKIFLTAKTLFKSEHFESSIDCEKVLKLSLDILEELSVLIKEIEEYLSQEQIVSEEYKIRKNTSDSYAIPSILNLNTRCKTIFQKADHIEQILMETIIIFYPDKGLMKQSHFPKFYDVLDHKYGKADSFTELIHSVLPFMKLIRSLRNCLDHRLDFVKVTNFEIQSDSNITSPTIELNHREDKLERTSLSSFLPIVFQNLILIIEVAFAHLANKNVKSNFMNFSVAEIPEDKRRYKFVRYCFWSPIGNEGFFNQY